MKYTPTSNRVLVEMDPLDRFWDDGQLLHRPNVGDEMPLSGTVRARGPGRWSKKRGLVKRLPMSVRPGQRVVIPWAVGTELTIAGRYHREVTEDEILAVHE